MLNSLDIVLIVVVLGAAFLGMLRGVLAEILGLVGILVGIFLASHYGAAATAAMKPVFRNPELSFFIAFLGLFVFGMVAFFIFRLILKSAMADSTPGPLSRLLAALLGAVKGVIIISVVLFLVIFLWSPENSFTSGSRLVPRFLRYCGGIVCLLPEKMQSPLRDYLEEQTPAATEKGEV